MVELSGEQRVVVEWPGDGGHLLVLAAPGSGKTLTIVERIGRLIDGGVAPEQVLATTFTRRAAADLQARLPRPGVWAGTFHAVCADLLAKDGASIGWEPPLRILDEGRQREELERAFALAGHPVEAGDREADRLVRRVRDGISRRKRRGHADPNDPADALALQVEEIYAGLLAEARALDFDDLVVRAVELLRDDAAAAERLHRRVRFVFVDEFHDVSPEQYELLRLLAPPRRRGRQVTAVADPDQAIYGWRDADAVRMLAQLRRDYAPRTVRLTRNYRSAGTIVRAAGRVIADTGRTAQPTVAAADHLPIDCCAYADIEGEAEGLAGLIERARSRGGYGYGDMAVLYRGHRRADAAEAALLRREIPIWRVEAGRFFAEPDVQEGLRYLDLVAALHDDAFVPALNWPRVLLDELTMVHLRRLAAAEGLPLVQLARDIDRYADRVTPLTRHAVKGFLRTVDAELAPALDRPIDAIVERLLPTLNARRHPLPRAERETFGGVLEFLGAPLVPLAGALAGAVAAGRPVCLRHAGDLDSAAAAVILGHLLADYLLRPAPILGPGERADPAAFVVELGAERALDGGGFGLGVRRTRTMAYSVATQAWRLGQLVLIGHETLADGRFVVFDLETGSNHPASAEIVEVAAVPVEGGRPVGGGFAGLVRPSGPAAVTADASGVNGLRWADLAAAPPPATVLPHLLGALGDATLVGHNVENFDMPILRRAVSALGLDPPRNPLVDTCKMARRLLPDAPHRLVDLAQRFGLATAQQHRALPDAYLTAGVFARLTALERAERELDSLAEALPLVALSVLAAGVPAADENATLLLAGARALAFGQGADPLGRLRALVDCEPALRDLAARPIAVAEDDARWGRLAERWRSVAAHYRATATDHGLPAFLRYAALASAADYVPELQPAGATGTPDPRHLPAIERVAMMTVHSAKGLEWPLVFLLGVEDGQFPIWNADDPEEERRVLYVGLTRARRRVVALWARQTHGRRRELSPFLRELPAELMVHRR